MIKTLNLGAGVRDASERAELEVRGEGTPRRLPHGQGKVCVGLNQSSGPAWIRVADSGSPTEDLRTCYKCHLKADNSFIATG